MRQHSRGAEASELSLFMHLSGDRGRRECRVHERTHCHACKTKETHAGQHRYAELTPALPAQWFYGCSALSPAIGLFCHRPSRALDPGVDSSVEESGPHGLTVRGSAARLATQSRPSHPAPTNRGDREPPLLESAGWGIDSTVSNFRKCGKLTRRASLCSKLPVVQIRQHDLPSYAAPRLEIL